MPNCEKISLFQPGSHHERLLVSRNNLAPVLIFAEI
jgi:hypothetical protein